MKDQLVPLPLLPAGSSHLVQDLGNSMHPCIISMVSDSGSKAIPVMEGPREVVMGEVVEPDVSCRLMLLN